jgi:hypothetical protein
LKKKENGRLGKKEKQKVEFEGGTKRLLQITAHRCSGPKGPPGFAKCTTLWYTSPVRESLYVIVIEDELDRSINEN